MKKKRRKGRKRTMMKRTTRTKMMKMRTITMPTRHSRTRWRACTSQSPPPPCSSPLQHKLNDISADSRRAPVCNYLHRIE